MQRLRAEQSKTWATETMLDIQLNWVVSLLGTEKDYISQGSIAVQLGHVTELWPTEYGYK